MNKIVELSEQELVTLERFVSNREEWSLLKKIFEANVAKFWEALRLTPIADEKQVAANHKLAVGVETFCTEVIQDMEAAHYVRTHPTPKELGDITKDLLK